MGGRGVGGSLPKKRERTIRDTSGRRGGHDRRQGGEVRGGVVVADKYEDKEKGVITSNTVENSNKKGTAR